jgi:pyruvate kinase
MSPPFVRSKIVCTIGPASEQPETLMKMAEAGMDVARINLSHGDIDFHRRITRAINDISTVSTLIDLPGLKIRIGEVKGSVDLKPGNEIRFTTKSIIGDENRLPISYDKLPMEIKKGGSLFINDGLIEVNITSIDQNLKGFTGKVISGGDVMSRKGINVPGATLSTRLPTEADIEGIRFAVDVCDWLAISFVRNREDVENTRREIERAGGDQPLISKIEHEDAIKNIDEIIEISDGIMVARGDLGIEIPPWEVPLLQKRIISKCKKAGKPVIVATQMLESMVTNPRPTRAEASDVANAILDGADAVMLSEETAVGLFPIEAVKVMNNISLSAERGKQSQSNKIISTEGPIANIIGDLAARAAKTVEPSAIIVVTRSGFSARMVSKYRPMTRILAVTRNQKISRRARLYWGVEPLDIVWSDDRDELLMRAMTRSLQKGIIGEEDVVLIVSGSTLEAPGRTSTLEVLNVKDILYYASRRN